jgi:hypothetical protein
MKKSLIEIGLECICIVLLCLFVYTLIFGFRDTKQPEPIYVHTQSLLKHTDTLKMLKTKYKTLRDTQRILNTKYETLYIVLAGDTSCTATRR